MAQQQQQEEGLAAADTFVRPPAGPAAAPAMLTKEKALVPVVRPVQGEAEKAWAWTPPARRRSDPGSSALLSRDSMLVRAPAEHVIVWTQRRPRRNGNPHHVANATDVRRPDTSAARSLPLRSHRERRDSSIGCGEGCPMAHDLTR